MAEATTTTTTAGGTAQTTTTPRAYRDERERNDALCESRVPLLIVEQLSPLAGTVRKVAGGSPAYAEAKGKGGARGKGDLWEAKVGHANRKNGNHRVYPEAVWRDQIERLAPLLKDGYLTGAVDHDWYGGSLRDTCIVYRDLWIEASDKGVWARFEILEGHSRGKDLAAQCEGGVAVGFSTAGRGTAHEPGDAERAEFGLAKDDYAVVIDRNYELEGIDAVKNPSVRDARLKRDGLEPPPPGGGVRESNDQGHGAPRGPRPAETENTMDSIETLEQLKTKAPKAFAAHEAAVAAAVEAATAPLKAQMADAKRVQKALTDAVNGVLPALKELPEVKLPQREMVQSEIAAEMNNLRGQITRLEAEKATLGQDKQAAEQRAQQLDAQIKDAHRRQKVLAKADAVLKDNGHADAILDLLDEALAADSAFDESKVEGFVAKKSEWLDKLTGGGGGGGGGGSGAGRKTEGRGGKRRGGGGEPEGGAGVRGRSFDEDEFDERHDGDGRGGGEEGLDESDEDEDMDAIVEFCGKGRNVRAGGKAKGKGGGGDGE